MRISVFCGTGTLGSLDQTIFFPENKDKSQSDYCSGIRIEMKQNNV